MAIVTGSKFASDRDIAEIAALVRADFAQAAKAGQLPKGFKASVRVSRYSMGQSITVQILAAPSVAIVNPARVRHDRDHDGEWPLPARHALEGQRLLEAVQAIVDAYNCSDIRPDLDVCNQHFFAHVDFSSALEAADAARVTAELPANANAA